MKHGTWRRESGAWFAAIVLGVLIAEIGAATLLTWSFVGEALGIGLTMPVESLVIGGITTGAMALLGLTVYLLGFHVLGERRRARHESQLEVWTERWVRVMFLQDEEPEGPLSHAAQDALVALCESMHGDEAERLRGLISSHGIDERLMNDVSSGDARKRLEALEGLAMARLPQSLDLLIDRMLDPRPEIRMMAGRAAARTIGSMRPSPVLAEAADRFVDALVTGNTPRGIFEEMLLLTGAVGGRLERRLLADPSLPTRLVAPVIDAAGRGQDPYLFDLVMDHARSGEPEARAAVLRFIGRMGAIPAEAVPVVVNGIKDDIEFVRVNAVRAGRNLAPGEVVHELWARLADPSWWVRKGAAESLATMGEPGESTLLGAAHGHPDRYGRDMAAQVIADTGISPRETVAA